MIQNEPENLMKTLHTIKYPVLILIFSMATLIIFDQAAWERTFGLQFLLTTLLILFFLLILIRLEKKNVPWKSWLLLIPVLFGAVMTVIRREGSTTFFNIILTLSSLTLIALTLRSGKWLRYRFQDLLIGILKLIRSAFIGLPGGLIKKLNRQSNNKPMKKENSWKKIRPYLIGLLIALPLLLVLTLLLASADMIFKDRVLNLFDFFRIDNIVEVLFRAFYITIFAYLLAGIYIHALTFSADRKGTTEDKTFIKPFLGNIEALVVLGLVNLLFLSFIIIQIRYFFAGTANISSEGFTYAEYARRGFFELVAVAIISLGIFYILSLVTKREKSIEKQIFSLLGILLISQVGLMLVSAFQRLNLYEAAYGFTRLRTITHIFMIWLGVLLVGAVVMEILNQFHRMAVIIFLVFFGFTLTLNFLNVDQFIVRRNIERALAGQSLDADYLVWNISSDGVPALFSYKDDKETPKELRDILNASLACYYAANLENFGRSMYWSEWHLSDVRAAISFDQEKESLESYPFKTRSEKVYYEENGKEMQETIASYYIIVDDTEIWCKSDDFRR